MIERLTTMSVAVGEVNEDELSDEEEDVPKPERKTYQRVFLFLYYIWVVIVVLIFFCRFATELAKLHWRHNIDTYPTECSDWAVKGGCTRVSIYKDQCVRGDQIIGEYSSTFNVTQPAGLNAKIAECASRSIKNKLQYPNPRDLSGSVEWQPFIHMTWTSAFFGFVDDVFIETYLNTTADPMYSVVNIQSQLRIGYHDFNANEDHVRRLYKCLNNNLKTEISYISPCSL